MMSNLPTLTAQTLKAARLAAGHTQAQAATLVHASSYRTWQDWEAGKRTIPLMAWELYLIKTNRHGDFIV